MIEPLDLIFSTEFEKKEHLEKIEIWKNLKKSQRISLLEEYEYSLIPFEAMDEKQKKKFEKLILKNMEFRDKADWSIICDLKNIDENLIKQGISA